MELFYNPKLVRNIYKANKKMCIHSNGGKMLITNKAQVCLVRPKNYHQPHLPQESH